ncbi:MAG: Bacterial regulatory protein, tetR family [Candidatus Izimaplasma bacterium HR2]|nr:MAG: Bacterial regulatory protein, tetR family [Candidatus Izimaplasma bacterium HR2]
MFSIEKLDMRIKYTREWTFEALYKLLENNEYDKIKITDIITKAGISRATFYRNFSTKDDIIKLKVKMFFEFFYVDIVNRYKQLDHEDEIFLIQNFFNSVDEEEKLISTVIKTNLEYLMVQGILDIINMQRDKFYKIVKPNEKSEKYTMEIVASSAWTLLSRWIKTGKEETASELVNIYLVTFKSVYIALFGDKSDLA